MADRDSASYGIIQSFPPAGEWVISSAGEDWLHTAGVTCSIHVSPTRKVNEIKVLSGDAGAFFLSVGQKWGKWGWKSRRFPLITGLALSLRLRRRAGAAMQGNAANQERRCSAPHSTAEQRRAAFDPVDTGSIEGRLQQVGSRMGRFLRILTRIALCPHHDVTRPVIGGALNVRRVCWQIGEVIAEPVPGFSSPDA